MEKTKEDLKKAWDAAIKEAVNVQELGFKYKVRTFEEWYLSEYPPIELTKKFECYEIHVVQARMYGCSEQCKECKNEQSAKNEQ